MAAEKCIDAYGNERPEGHIHVQGHAGCPRCGAPENVRNHVRKYHPNKES